MHRSTCRYWDSSVPTIFKQSWAGSHTWPEEMVLHIEKLLAGKWTGGTFSHTSTQTGAFQGIRSNQICEIRDPHSIFSGESIFPQNSTSEFLILTLLLFSPPVDFQRISLVAIFFTIVLSIWTGMNGTRATFNTSDMSVLWFTTLARKESSPAAAFLVLHNNWHRQRASCINSSSFSETGRCVNRNLSREIKY